MRYSYSLLAIFIFLCLLTGCGRTTADPSAFVSAQPDEIDDLTATLEEAVLTLTGDVSDTITRIDTLGTPSGTKEEQYQIFLDFKNDISKLENRIDDLDDTVESNYRRSYLSLDDYRKLSDELESLDELMDAIEEKLEFIFKIDD